MAKNIAQVYATNPSTQFIATDLVYIGHSPYGLTDDSAILISNIFNATNLQLTSGQLNTIQDIDVLASPTFYGLTLTNDLSIGFVGPGPTDGAMIAGQVVIGTDTIPDYCKFYMHEDFDAVSGGYQIYHYINPVLNPAGGSTNTFASSVNPTFIANAAQTITFANAFRVEPSVSTNVGTISTLYTMYIHPGATGAGTVSEAVSAYISSPLYGTTTTNNYGVIIYGSDSPGSTTGTRYLQWLGGTITGDSGNNQFSMFINTTMRPTTNTRNVYGIYCGIIVQPYSTNTIPIAFGVVGEIIGSVGSGTIGMAYSGYFSTPSIGTNKAALYADNLSIGYTGTTPPTNSVLISGSLIVGSTSSPFSRNYFFGSFTGVDSGYNIGTLFNITLSPSASVTNSWGIYNYSSFVAAGGNTTTLATTLYCYPTASANAGTITTMAGLYIFAGTSSAGTVTNAYGLHVDSPLYGTGTNNYGVIIYGSDSYGSTTGSRALLTMQGTVTADNGTYARLIDLSSVTVSPTVNSRYVVMVEIDPVAVAYSTNTINTVIGVGIRVRTTPGAGTIGLTTSCYVQTAIGTASVRALYTDDLSVGYNNSVPPIGGMIVSGKVGFGASIIPGLCYIYFSGDFSTVDSGYNLYNFCNITLNPNVSVAAVSAGEYFNVAFIAPSASTITYALGIRLGAYAATNIGTISNLAALYIVSGSASTGTVINSYGIYIESPLGGTGTSNYGLVVYGSDSAGSATGTRSLQWLTGTITGDNGTNQFSILVDNTLSPASNSRNVYGIYCGVYVQPYSTNTIAIAYGVVGALIGSVGSGTIVTSYSGYFANPTVGTNKAALYADNLSIGYTATTPPTNGLIVSGYARLGTSGAYSTTALVAYDSVSTRDPASSSTGTTPSCTVRITSANNISLDMGGFNTAPYPFWLQVHDASNQAINYGLCLQPNGGAVSIQNIVPNSASQLHIAGVRENVDGSTIQYGNLIETIFYPTNGSVLSSAICVMPFMAAPSTKTMSITAGIYVDMKYTSNVGTLTETYGVYIDEGSSGAGTITTATCLFVAKPTAGTTNICATFMGAVGIGTIPSVPNEVELTLYSEKAVAFSSTGSQTAVDGSSAQFGWTFNSTFNPTSGSSRSLAALFQPLFIAPTAQTITYAASQYIYNVTNSNIGTITTAYGIWIDAGSAGGGTITTGIGLRVTTPAHGTTKICAQFDGPIKYLTNTTGAGTALLGTNSPAITVSAPYTWITVVTSDGSTAYVPAWK